MRTHVPWEGAPFVYGMVIGAFADGETSPCHERGTSAGSERRRPGRRRRERVPADGSCRRRDGASAGRKPLATAAVGYPEQIVGVFRRHQRHRRCGRGGMNGAAEGDRRRRAPPAGAEMTKMASVMRPGVQRRRGVAGQQFRAVIAIEIGRSEAEDRAPGLENANRARGREPDADARRLIGIDRGAVVQAIAIEVGAQGPNVGPGARREQQADARQPENTTPVTREQARPHVNLPAKSGAIPEYFINIYRMPTVGNPTANRLEIY